MRLNAFLSTLHSWTRTTTLVRPRLHHCSHKELTHAVVGGGPSGLTVANRLSENPAVNVLLLEAGPADDNEPWIQIPFFAGQGVGSSLDWNLMTVPQTYLDGKARALPQGRVLGGGTVLNAML